MKYFAISLIMTTAFISCKPFEKPKTLDQVKEYLDCTRYEKGISWKQISEKLGPPDIAPLPEPGTDLAKNARIYKDKTIIFYTERQEIREGDKVRFQEVVTDIEACKEK